MCRWVVNVGAFVVRKNECIFTTVRAVLAIGSSFVVVVIEELVVVQQGETNAFKK